MTDALRELLAIAEVRVTGIDAVHAANRAVDALKKQLAAPLNAGGLMDFNANVGGTKRALDATVGTGRAAEQATPKIQSFGGSVSEAYYALGLAGQALGIVRGVMDRTVGVAVDVTREVIGLGDALDAQSKRTGISTRELQRWQFIAERGNVDADALVGSIGKLERAAFQASTGHKAQAAAFRGVGISVKDANGQLKPAGDLFREVGLRLAGIQNPTERAARAQEIFGRSGAALLPIFADGADGIDALSRRFDELGGGLDDETVAAAAAADDAMVDFDLSLRSVKATLVSSFLPAVTATINGTATFLGTIKELVANSSIAQTAVGGIAVAAGVLAVLMAPIIAPTLAVVAGLGLLFLVAEDVVTAFRGGDSVFGAWEESLASSLGVTLTFRGQVEAMGLAWLNLKANVLESTAGILDGIRRTRAALGLPTDASLDSLAAGAHAAAASARGDERAAGKALITNQRQERADRAVLSAQDAIDAARPSAPLLQKATDAAVQGRALGGGRLPGAHRTVVRAPVAIHINGAQSPEAIARAVDQRLDEHFQSAGETLPNADDDEDGGED